MRFLWQRGFEAVLSVSGGVVLQQVGPRLPSDLGSAVIWRLCPFRECQVRCWPKHKKACEMLAEASEKIETSLHVGDRS